MWSLSFFSLLQRLNEKQSEKVSIILRPRESSRWVGEKEGNTPWDLLFELTRRPLMFTFWWLVKESREERCQQWGEPNEESISIWVIWLVGRDITCSCNLPLSFCRWDLMDIRPTSASIPSIGEVLNAPSIQMAALLCILPRVLSEYDNGAQL